MKLNGNGLLVPKKQIQCSSHFSANKPVTSKQLEDYRHYQSKFSDIAKAYSEGYKGNT